MPGDLNQTRHSPLDIVLSALSNWVNKYRQLTGRGNEFGYCTPDDVRQIANELGVPPAELRALAAKGPGAADLLEKMLIALHVDPKTLATANPAVMRDLQRLCITCSHKGRCEHELAQGTAADRYHEFCPNAFTLDALFHLKAPTQH